MEKTKAVSSTKSKTTATKMTVKMNSLDMSNPEINKMVTKVINHDPVVNASQQTFSLPATLEMEKVVRKYKIQHAHYRVVIQQNNDNYKVFILINRKANEKFFKDNFTLQRKKAYLNVTEFKNDSKRIGRTVKFEQLSNVLNKYNEILLTYNTNIETENIAKVEKIETAAKNLLDSME